MKNIAMLLAISGCILIASCKKNTSSDAVTLLTGPTWVSDSLLVNGVDGSSTILKNFHGEAKFNSDGTGKFGSYTGTWRFALNETQLVISSDSLPIPLTTKVVELKQSSLKLTTSFPDPQNLGTFWNIRMTFKPK